MAETKNIQKQEPKPKATLAMTSRGFEPTDIEGVYRQANLMAKSDFVMPMYKNNEGNCMILVEMSVRLGVPWMMLMQHMYIVHERPALDATISTALVNRSGEFKDPLEYEVEGENAKGNDYRVRAYATRTSTGRKLYGPWIDWPLVKGEGWDSKSGSKWKTMPDQMFHYRAASWFQRRYCPELTMGMLTTDEAIDAGPPRKHVESQTFDEAQAAATEKIKAEAGSEVVETDPKKADLDFMNDEDPKAKDEAEKKLLAEAEKKAKAKATRDAKKAKDKNALPKYHCPNCKPPRDFDEGVNVNLDDGTIQCQKCLNWNVETPNAKAEIDPDIAEENN